MPEERSAICAVVRGRVQGVGFRDYVERRARFLKLTGFVRNLDDGVSVEVVAEGSRDDLSQLIEHLHGGPGMARVDNVDVEWRPATGGHDRFRTAW